jgi:fatty-acyl-CoA synthase
VSFTLAHINEAIADAIPDREAIVSSRRRLTWRDLQLRSRRLANLFLQHGLGCRRERDGLQPWESGQDHVALYLYNGHEYLEGMLGAFKARAVPFNVNYRYVEDGSRTAARRRNACDRLPRHVCAAVGAGPEGRAADGIDAPGRRRQW